MSILDTYTARDLDLSLSELSERTGMPKTTVHRLVTELTTWGALARGERGWRLGPKLRTLGNSVATPKCLLTVARPYLEDLYQITRKTVNLGVMINERVTYLERLESPETPTPPPEPTMPLYCTAVGKALLAFAPAYITDNIERRGLKPYTDRTISSAALLRRELASIRATHLSTSNEEMRIGTFCIGTPIFDSASNLVGGISISNQESMYGVQNLGPAILAVSRAISRELGTGMVRPAQAIAV